jgi:hypothetical protein
MGTRALSQGAKRQGPDHSRSSSAEVKNTWSYTSTPSICLYLTFINAERTKQHRNNTTKPQTNTFSISAKITHKKVSSKVFTYYSRSIQQTAGKKKNFCKYYESC